MRLLLSLFLLVFIVSSAKAASPSYTFLIQGYGGRVDWGQNHLIAFDRVNADGWFKIWVMAEDGTQQKCLSCGKGFPTRHTGNPAWHPSGKYIVYQAVDDKLKVSWLLTGVSKFYTNPGAGANNNIWIMTADGSRTWQLTNLGRGKGVLHPHFSPDGKYLLWAELEDTHPMPLGSWVMKLAEFSESNGVPVLGKVKTLRPGVLQFYETHNFSPDGTQFLFTGKKKDGGGHSFDIYKYTIADNSLQQLTSDDGDVWDEHAHFSPDGKKIIWMSSKDNGKQFGSFIRTDWWLMDADGSNKRRLTRFNVQGAPEYIKGKAIASDISWSPDGKQAVGYLQDNATGEKPGDVVKFNVE